MIHTLSRYRERRKGLAAVRVTVYDALMPPPKRFPEQTLARFLAGTLARIRRVLADDETQGAMIRAAVARELRRRERANDAAAQHRKETGE